MTLAIALVFAIVVLAVVLFAFERIPMELSALTIVTLLAVTRLLTPEQAFAGFSDPAVIFIFALLVMTQGLAGTGVVQIIGQRMAFFARYGHTLFVTAMMIVVATFSSFVSNTVTTAAFLPVAIGAAERAKVPPSKVLMPLAYASILGGTILLIGTSTNLVVSSALVKMGMPAIGFFELAPIGLPIAVVGIVMVVLLSRWLLPTRTGHGEETLGGREFLAEAVLPEGSRYLGLPLSEITQGLGFRVLGVIHDGVCEQPDPQRVLAAGDRLILEEDRLNILKVKDLRGIEILPDAKLGTDTEPGTDQLLVEAAIPTGSELVGRSLKESFFAQSFGAVVLAISRRPAIQRLTKLQLLQTLLGSESLSKVPLAVGDVLLIRGPRERVRSLANGSRLMLLRDFEYQPPRYGKALLALVIFIGVLTAGSLDVLPLSVAGLVGLLLMLATRCTEPRVAFRVDWRVVLLIGSMMALGTAMETSGAGTYLGSKLVPLAGVVGPRGVLVLLMLFTVILSAPMSNQAAALVLLPVAAGVAKQLGLDPRPFAMGICLSASLSFITPLEPSCVLVFGPGHYRFTDFFRLGLPLTAVLLAMLAMGVPWVWPFH